MGAVLALTSCEVTIHLTMRYLLIFVAFIVLTAADPKPPKPTKPTKPVTKPDGDGDNDGPAKTEAGCMKLNEETGLKCHAWSGGIKGSCTDGEDADDEKCEKMQHDNDDNDKNTGTQANSAASILGFVAFAVCFVI